jgi:hypothetical protein|tara:strand:+ start:38581 stop:38778 length:198 start_codon:yes stop_codon:yes gene_type:complete
MVKENKSGCKYWDIWIYKFGGKKPSDFVSGLGKNISHMLEPECCYKKDSTLCPDCWEYYIGKMKK